MISALRWLPYTIDTDGCILSPTDPEAHRSLWYMVPYGLAEATGVSRSGAGLRTPYTYLVGQEPPAQSADLHNNMLMIRCIKVFLVGVE